MSYEKLPDPKWVRNWSTFFFKKPYCEKCDLILESKQDWFLHYVLKHWDEEYDGILVPADDNDYDEMEDDE